MKNKKELIDINHINNSTKKKLLNINITSNEAFDKILVLLNKQLREV